ncbi:MAG TPA: hypothetical protein VKR27_02105 [Acidimicrobiales bacterium]|nr:hypothetical protein [Acidimicrobiales bacterium]
MERTWTRKLFRVGVVAGGVLAIARFVPKWFEGRTRRREAAAISATDGLWPPVPPSTSESARVLAPLADQANEKSEVSGE